MANWTFGGGGSTNTKSKAPQPSPIQPVSIRTNVPIETYVPSPDIRTRYIPTSPLQSMIDKAKGVATIAKNAAGGYSGGGGGVISEGDLGGSSAANLAWNETYSSTLAPTWWRGKTPTIVDENTKYAMLMNSLIPYLSPEDQRTYASNLYRNYSNAFPEYNPETMQYPVPSTEMSTEMRQRFTNKDRAQKALETLSQVASLTGQTDETMGSGYKFLRNLMAVMKDFGGESTSNQQTRAQYLQQLSALDPLLAESKAGDLSPYSSMAQSLASPYFTAGSVVPIQKTSDGRYIFGSGNRKWY